MPGRALAIGRVEYTQHSSNTLRDVKLWCTCATWLCMSYEDPLTMMDSDSDHGCAMVPNQLNQLFISEMYSQSEEGR